MTEKSFAEVFVSQNIPEALMVLDILKTGGFDAVIFDSMSSGYIAGSGPAIPSRVMVPKGQEKDALELLAGMRE